MKIFKNAAVALMATALFAACSEEQSTFNIEDVPGRCLLQGQIVYNQGTTYENGKFVYDYKPVASTEVYVTIRNNSFGESLVGETVLTTTTDEQGNYSIEIPAPEKATEVTVTTPDFVSVRRVADIVNNKVETREEEVVFRGNHNFSVHSHGIVMASLKCTECNRDANFNGFNDYVTLVGTIGQNAEYKIEARAIRNENARVRNVFVPASSADVILKINYGNEANFTYNTTTDANGNFTVNVPVEGYPARFSYEVKVVPYNGKFIRYEAVKVPYENYRGDEKTYIDYIAHILDGYYSQQNNSVSFNADVPVAAEHAKCEAKIMLFNPLDNGQDTYGYEKSRVSSADPWLDDLKAQLEKENNK